jgi:DNA repair exonuclease SbcCD ATPase subunit
MIFTEIAFQNVAGSPPTGRVPLAAGLNAFVSPEMDLFLLLRALFAPLTEDVSALFGPTAPRKVALTIQGDDGQTYRLVRDLDSGRMLLRSDPATRKPVKLSEDPTEIARMLQGVAGVPDWEFLRGHFWLVQEDLPSRRVVASTEPNSRSAEVAHISPADARERLPALHVELQRAEQFEQTQDSLYDLQSRLAELSKGGAVLTDLEKQIAELNRRVDGFQKIKDVTAGVEARIKKFPEALARRDGALLELKKKRADYEQNLTSLPPEGGTLWQDKLVQGGLVAGVACVVAAVAFGKSYLWAADLLGFGAAAVGAWRWVGQAEDGEKTQRRLIDVQDLEKRIQKQFEVDTAPVYAAMSKLGVNSPEDVMFKLEERDLLDARRVALLRELEQKKSDTRLMAVEQERQALEQDVKAQEAFVNSMGFSRDTGAIRKDLALCEDAVANEAKAPSDPLQAAVEAAALYAVSDPRVLLETLRERLGQYLAALTGRRFVGIRVASGQYHVVASNGAAGPLSGLPEADRDVVYIALRLALAERVAAPARRPIFFDEPSVLVDAAHRGLFVKMLKSLGAMTQVVVRAFDAPPAGVVDNIARLGT